jgi:formiminoglutamase
MTKPSDTQSQKRYLESVGALFQRKSKNADFLFLKSSSDIGVIRNGGRNGARYAPQSFLSVFKKLALSSAFKDLIFIDEEVASLDEEQVNFEEAQQLESQRIEKFLNQHPKAQVYHLGGGHDHIYPLLKAASKGHKRVIVINIDAHADTRIDVSAHSGTPFRQFAREYEGDFQLYQIGLLPFANSLTTLSPLEKGKMHILWRDQLKNPSKVEDLFSSLKNLVDDSTLVLLSVDADALDGQEIPGVSAVNGEGLTGEELSFLWGQYHALGFKHPPLVGLYELNPVFDTLSMLSMRKLAAWIYKSLPK